MAARPVARTSVRSAARSTTRGSRPSDRARPAVRDYTGSTPPVAVEWDVRVVYDFLFSLSKDAGSTDDVPAADREWLATARSSLTPEIRTDMEDLLHSEVAIHAAPFVVEHPEISSVDDLIGALDVVPTADLMRSMLSDFRRDPKTGALIDLCATGDPGAVEELTDAMPEHNGALRELLSDPVASHHRILRVLTAWAKPYRQIEARVLSILERDLAMRTDDKSASDVSDLIERTTGGIRWLPEMGISRVILAPSYFTRPFNFLFAGEDWRFYGYPVSDDAVDAGDRLSPPPAVIRLHRALGDETRLRILKLLAGRDLYLTEIAQQLDLSKPTIKHHLAMLRAAGLVTVTESSTVVYYSLRTDRIQGAAGDLESFLRT